MKNNWVVIAIILALVAATIFVWEKPPQSLLPLSGEEGPKRSVFPYAVIKDAHTLHFDEHGQLSYEFFAQTLNHFRRTQGESSENDFTTLSKPEFTLYSGDDIWYVTAEEGHVSQQGSMLKLRVNVKVRHPQDTQGETELLTSELIILPNEKVVKTDAEVKIISPQGVIEAVGMTVDLNTQKMQLLNRVRGIHEPI